MRRSINYYKILGVTSKSNDEQIISAYQRLLLKYNSSEYLNHPSKEKNISKIIEAFENLIDPIKRSDHDQNLKNCT